MPTKQTGLNPSNLQSEEKGNVAKNPEGDPRSALAAVRTNLAKFRTSLALDRTTLAWIRTAVTFATFGFGTVGFFRSVVQATHDDKAVRLHQSAIRMGVALIVIGLVAMIVAAFSHWMALRRLRRGEQLSITPWPLAITLAVLIALLGFYGLSSIFAP
jgi:putative membrane protein